MLDIIESNIWWPYTQKIASKLLSVRTHSLRPLYTYLPYFNAYNTLNSLKITRTLDGKEGIKCER